MIWFGEIMQTQINLDNKPKTNGAPFFENTA